MKNFLHCLWFVSVALLIPSQASTQQLTKVYQEQTVKKLAELVKEFYVHPDVADATAAQLLDQLAQGHFKQYKTIESFAAALTQSVQSVNKDKHMQVLLQPPYLAPENTSDRMLEERLERNYTNRKNNGGFNEVRILEGNVGYLDIRSFPGMDQGKPIADAYMKLLANADAIIINLSKNTGGSPAMVQYLCSYFFDKELLLNTLYFRLGDELHEFWVMEHVDGIKLPEVPLFVMTSGQTFSGAEEFAYNMQTHERATIIGQTSRGGANPGRSMDLNEDLRVIMPMGMAINPITKTNWEGVGVEPDIKIGSGETFDRTHILAIDAAEAYRKEVKDKATKLFLELYSHLESYSTGETEESLLASLTACTEANLLEEGAINMLGYEYLLEKSKPKIAEAIFYTNTQLYPDSPNTFDSYAEALMTNGDFERSAIHYQKAVELATTTGRGDPELYKRNLENVQAKIKSKD